MKDLRVLTIVTAENPKHSIVKYGEVASRSNPGVRHIVTKTRGGVYRCSCRDGMFNPGKCDHIEAFKEKE